MAGLCDLHRHLDGSLRPETVRELAQALHLPVPADLLFRPGMSLADALSRFAFTLSLLRTPAAVERVAREICDDAAADGVRELEIRFGPQLHIDEQARASGITRSHILDAVLAGVAGRAGVILCGIYGEEPDVLDELIELAAARPGVVGIDLAGGPLPEHRARLADYRGGFERAAALGLGRTVHAGEGRPPSEIREAIEILGAQRIGHGTTLLEDAKVTELVRERGVVIEACLTSNVHTGVIRSVDEHPLVRWLARGIRAVVCTDNTLLSDVSASGEYARARRLPGMTEALFQQLIEQAPSARFRRQAAASP
jgi:adenosine deaminase